MAKVVAVQWLGRMGNNCFQYCYARAYAERHGFELQTDPWIGEQVFDLKHPRIAEPDKLKRVDENTIQEGEGDVLIRSYCQNQKSLIYTRKDCLRWFKFQPWVHEALSTWVRPVIAMHVRRGDYMGYGYPMVSEESYIAAMSPFYGMPIFRFYDSAAGIHSAFNGELKDIPDFYQMTRALVLLRANSTFSWWAGTLNHGAVYAPIMDNCKGGVENDCEFVRGNWPAFRKDLDFITDLHLPE